MLERQVYRMPKAGSIDHLTLQTEPLSPPQPDQVCVQVHAVGLNFADVFAMQGLYSATPEGSFIPGLEFSGEIIAVGKAVTTCQVGDRVMGVTRFGGYVSHININFKYVIPLPREWSFEQGAGFLVQGLTAYYALKELGNLQKGMTVLIHSAAGGVGILANRICKKLEAYTIGTVGQANKVDFLKKEEAYDQVILRGKDFEAQLQKALGEKPLNLIMECIGGEVLSQGWKVLAPMGRMVVYGNASFSSHSSKPNYPKLIWKFLQRPKIDPLRLPTENKSLMGFNLIYLYEQTQLMHQLLGELQALNLAPQHIGHTFPHQQILEAIHLFQRGKTVGKVVVTW
ncbi:zinc-binding dehydrogenase [Rufibacter sp. DG15C]|uniref:synaptic vesicle VAT-1 family membrane protein n=1 Tax=Rufibacter sp. DG15C TaxID=1379909 RepID=UPI00078C527B|nr:medium chain dehydrogenase/reductase family protein [Rufibacter sp. DG15C]AMM52141.1 zinc-binding dehydrogenase [Rufibacter sp. DG15C]